MQKRFVIAERRATTRERYEMKRMSEMMRPVKATTYGKWESVYICSER